MKAELLCDDCSCRHEIMGNNQIRNSLDLNVVFEGNHYHFASELCFSKTIHQKLANEGTGQVILRLIQNCGFRAKAEDEGQESSRLLSG